MAAPFPAQRPATPDCCVMPRAVFAASVSVKLCDFDVMYISFTRSTGASIVFPTAPAAAPHANSSTDVRWSRIYSTQRASEEQQSHRQVIARKRRPLCSARAGDNARACHRCRSVPWPGQYNATHLTPPRQSKMGASLVVALKLCKGRGVYEGRKLAEFHDPHPRHRLPSTAVSAEKRPRGNPQ